ANTGYNFVSWTEGGVVRSTNSTFTFTATTSRTLVANFTLKTYTISASAGVGGTISPSGNISVTHGDSKTFTISPTIGYHIFDVKIDGSSIGVVETFTFNNIDKDYTIAAIFEINSYFVSTSVTPASSGTVTGGGSYTHGSLANLTANASEGYTFSEWEGDATGNNNPIRITVDSEKQVIARFTLNNYIISTTASPLTGGTTSGGGSFNHGTELTVSAKTATGYNFVNWTENGTPVSTDSNYTFTASKNRILTANFILKKYNVSASVLPSGSGTISGTGTYNHGTLVTLVALPVVGWKFDNWTVNSQVVSSDSNYSFVLLGNKTLVAHFSKKIFNISLNVQPQNSGTTNGSGSYEYGSEVTITANPNVGWDFVNWTEGENIVFTTSTAKFTITKSRIFTANFVKRKYTVSTIASPIEGGVTFGDSIYTHGDIVTVNAIANSDSGWDFVNWTDNGTPVSTESTYAFSASKNVALTANFKLRSYTVSLSPNPNNAGIVTGAGTYTHGNFVTITATPNDGWLFANWTDEGVNVSNTTTYRFRIISNKTFVANFAHELYAIVGLPNPVDAGIVSGTGSFFFGQTAKIIAAPNYGWDFVNWTESGSVLSTNLIYEFSVHGDRTLTANFSLTNFSINCSAEPIEGGFTSGCGLSHLGQEMTVNAVPTNGYEFVKWKENGNEVSTDQNYTFNVERNRDLVAEFKLLVSVEINDNEIPEYYYISNAYPNPFNPATTIQFGLPEPSIVNVKIYNTNGQLVENLIGNVNLPAGNYANRFNAQNLSSGIYFYHIFAQSNISEKNFTKVGKLVLIK
ncbi:MAG: T9SS type A sorting domain-containing protein, partial [Ignavibacteriales bacterium]|nr:T9SS type A sorting domain-containing protein [Ignavibacteriales bacterium]